MTNTQWSAAVSTHFTPIPADEAEQLIAALSTYRQALIARTDTSDDSASQTLIFDLQAIKNVTQELEVHPSTKTRAAAQAILEGRTWEAMNGAE